MFRNFIRTALNLFLKPNCPLCDRPANGELCTYCTRQLLQYKSLNHYPLSSQVSVFVWGRHEGLLKRAIASMKYNNNPQIAQFLGDQLAEGWFSDLEYLTENSTENSTRPAKDSAKNPTETLVVVPIPMFVDKQKQRGFNQAELIARSFCRATGLPLKSQGLERVRETQAQFQLSAQQRQENLKDAFSLGQDFRRHLPNGSVLLVDDVFTTGATVQAAIQVLTQAKIKVAEVITVSTTKQPTLIKPTLIKKQRPSK
ncbi:MAG: ComF family protein [Microcoleaceae cyanobacterium]